MVKEEKKSLSQKSITDLRGLLAKKQEELAKSRVEALRKKNKNVKITKNLRTEVRRLKTWVREQELKGEM